MDHTTHIMICSLNDLDIIICTTILFGYPSKDMIDRYDIAKNNDHLCLNSPLYHHRALLIQLKQLYIVVILSINSVY